LGLVDKISPAFEQSPGHSSLRVVYLYPPDTMAVGIARLQARPEAKSDASSYLGSILQPSKGAIAGVGQRRCAEALQKLSPGSPLPILAVYTYLKQPSQPLRVFTLSQSLFCLLLQPILT
jgi:hypothetical protein